MAGPAVFSLWKMQEKTMLLEGRRRIFDCVVFIAAPCYGLKRGRRSKLISL
jgi:hypothetical protein